MRVIPPLDILNGAVTYTSSIAAGTGDPAAWVSGTNYAVGDRVRVDSSKKIYENIVAGVEAISPDLGTSTHWVEVEYMNRYAMFDTMRRTKSFATNTITLQFVYAKRIDSLAILGLLNVNSIYVKVTNNSAVVVYENTRYSPGTTYINMLLPPTTGATIDVTISGIGTIYVGAVIVGLSEYLGDTQAGISLGTQNFSVIERDNFGNVSLVPRGGFPVISKNLFALSAYVNRIRYVRTLLNATPAVWVGMENNEIPEYYDSLVILGFYRQFRITLANSVHANISLELEEV
jgi:hypothetical protein